MTCTCGARAPTFHLTRVEGDTIFGEARHSYAIDCPEHGLDALIAQATPHLDIDEEGGAERNEHGSDHGSAQTPLTPPG